MGPFEPLLVASLVLAACAPATTAPSPTGSGRAGLVVRHRDGGQQTACVEFSGNGITGEELLLQSGLDARLDMGNALGSLACSIDGEGCAFPEEPCLCECDAPGACGYWGYFGWDEERDSWTYAVLGARLRRLQDGDLDAWVWLDSTGPEVVAAALPEGISFDQVCPPE